MNILINFIVSLAGRILGDVLKEQAPALADLLVRRSTRRLPTKDRDRYEREWLADIRHEVVNDRTSTALAIALGTYFFHGHRVAMITRRRALGVTSGLDYIVIVLYHFTVVQGLKVAAGLSTVFLGAAAAASVRRGFYSELGWLALAFVGLMAVQVWFVRWVRRQETSLRVLDRYRSMLDGDDEERT